MKVKIKSEGKRVTQFLIDGHDFTKAPISKIDVCITGGDKPKLLFEADIDDIEIEGDFEVLRKIPTEKCVVNGNEIVINGSKFNTDVRVEDLAKAIIENFNKSLSSYRKKC